MSSASPRKEPSMDEILASIRRIIESGDEPAQGARDDERMSASDPNGGVLLRPTESAAVPLPRFDVHYVSSTDESSADERDPVSSDGRFHDFDATDIEHADHDGRVEIVSDDEGDPSSEGWTAGSAEALEARSEPAEMRSAEYDVAAPAVPPPAGNENTAPAEDDEAERNDSAKLTRNFSFEFDDEAFEAELQSDTWHSAAATPEIDEAPPLASTMEPSPPVRAEMPASVIDGASALLSAQAGDQVAAAFDDLTRAIRDGHMRSMEEMAREMMRPMLQEWLDDNLPRIVERLVRDEIERIARGPRR